MRQLHETAAKQTRAAEKHERKRHFDHNQRAPQSPARHRWNRALLA